MNIFTNDDYRRIQAWLKANAIKDSDFAVSEDIVPNEDILVITQNTSTVPTNYRIRIKDLLNASLAKIVIDSITAKSVKVNNVLTVDAANVKLDNEKGTTLQDVLNYFEDNKLNRHTDDTFDGNLSVKKNITIEGNIKSNDGTTTVEEDLEATGEITDGQGNMLSDVNSAAKGWKIEYQDPQQDEPTVRAKYVLKDYKGVPKGDIIKVYKDSAITNVYLGTTEDTCNPNTGEVTKYPTHDNNETLSIVYRLDTGKYMLVNVPLGIFTREAEFDKYRGLGIESNGQVFIKLASDVESSNYLHFNDMGEVSADGIENRILQDLGTIINSVANDGTMWGQYKKEEGTKDSPINEASRWGQYKQAEADRSELLNIVSSKINQLEQEQIQGGVYDVSTHYDGAVFKSLQDLLSSSNLSTLIPTSVRHGGMSIRFIQGSEQSSDNKYMQYRLMSDTFSTIESDWQGIDDIPTAGSNNLIKSKGVAKKIGIYAEDSITGNGSNWRIKSYSSRIIKANELIKIKITGPITFAGTSEKQSFLVVYLKKSSDNSIIKTFYEITGATAFADKEEFYTPAYDCYLYIEGRWHTNENLNVSLYTGLFPQVEKNTNDIATVTPITKQMRSVAWVIACGSINFNNTAHQVEIGALILANPTNNNRLTINATNINYNFNIAVTNQYWLVYNISQSVYTFVSAGTNTNDQVVVACIVISGNSSATPNTSKVNSIPWCSIRECSIDGVSHQSQILDNRLLINSLSGYFGYNPCRIKLNDIVKGTIYNGTLDTVPDCLANNRFIEVYPNGKINCLHSDDISIRISEYDRSKTYIKQTGYSKFDDLVLSENTYFIKISARYSERGYSDNNPISVSAYSEGDFGIEVIKSEKLEDINTDLYTPLVEKYEDKNYFVDGNIWVRSTNYKVKIIPVTGGGKITCTARKTITTRISFLNTFDEDYILENAPCAVDGTGNMNTPAGGTRVYDIPETCTYIALNCLYDKQVSLPESLIINGVEYIGNLIDSRIPYIEKTLSENLEDIDLSNNAIGINYQSTELGTIIRASIWHAAVDTATNNCLCSTKFFNVIGGSKITCYHTNVVDIRIIQYDKDKNYIRQNDTYAPLKSVTLADNTTFVRISALYKDDTYSSTNRITPEHYKEGDFGFYYYSAKKIAAIIELEDRVDNIESGVSENIIAKNIDKDAAVRATAKKAVSSDILPLSFIHISDIHTKGDNYKCFENACAYYNHYSNIKAMIVTGDLVYDTYADAMTWYDTALQKTTKPVLNVIGNHDAGQYNASKGLASQSSDKQCYDKYIAPYVEDWNVVQPSNAATEGKSYYYKDFADEKVRLIVLNEFETDYEINADGTGLVYSREYRAMRQAQVTWLIDTLTNTPNDFGVIVAYHQPDNLAEVDNEFVSFDLVGSYRITHGSPANIAYVYCSDKEWLPKILNAFATKSSLTLTVTQTGAIITSSPTLVCDCDFTNVQAEFICILNGHTHKDYIGHLANYPALKVLCVGADNLQYTSGFQPRSAGTPSEDLFNVVNIDRNRKTIKIIRIGSNASVTGQVRDQMIMSYAIT